MQQQNGQAVEDISMMNRIFEALRRFPIAVALAAAGAALPLSADDTEIYQSEYDANSGARPKVLIVFDDSGSMDELVDGQRPAYDPTATYTTSFTADRIYWSTDGSVPNPGDNRYFSASKNRCDASFDPLDDNGRFTAERARRWVDSTIQSGQCTYSCPTDTTYRNPPGPNNAGCYQQTTSTQPVTKLVYSRNDWDNNRCYNGLIYVDPPGGNNDACYEEVTSSDPITGWVYRQNDSNNFCPSPTSRLYVDPPGSNNAYDACFEEVTAAESAEVTEWTYVSDQIETCGPDVVVPGTWQALSNQVHSPSHVECRDDVTANNPENGSGTGDGYPQDNVSNGNEYGANPDVSIDWGDNPYTFYTSHYLNWYHDSSLVQQRTKLAIAQEVVTTIIQTNTSIDFGLMEFNRREGGRIVSRLIQNMTDAQRANLVTMVNQMDHSGYTPMCESMYEAYNYLAGNDLVYGNSAESGSDSRGVYDVLAKDTLAESPAGTYVSPNSDCAYTYIILMTDGYPLSDTGANGSIKTMTGASSCDSFQDYYGDNTENCMPELADYMATTDLDGDTTNGDQYGITYTIGFQTDQELLRLTAEKGKGEYYTANDAQQLTEAFQGALVGILSRETTFTSPAVAVDTFTRTQSRDEVFYAMFEPEATIDWKGNIKKLKLEITTSTTELVDANGAAALDETSGDIKSTAVTFWGTSQDGGSVDRGGVGALLAARDPATRTIYTNTGSGGAFQAFNNTNITATAMGVADNAALYSLFGASNATAFNQQVAWAQGFDAYDSDGDTTVNEPRDWILGDILHSQPLVLNYGARGSFTVNNPELRLLVGSNSGFVHMFGNNDGQEDWAFFPKELASILPLRRRNALSNDHVYGMDLTPVAYTKDMNGDGTLDYNASDKVWVFLGMRRGGSAYYALDLSNPDSPSFKWRIGAGDSGFGELGQTWSEPVVTRIPGYRDTNGIPKPVLIFGAGYDTGKDASGVGSADSAGRGIFIVDADTGALVWSVTPAANSTTNLSESGLVHSVPGDISTLDSNGDSLTDRIYFGDTGGNVWRVDLPGNTLPTSSQDTWQINKLGAFNGATEATDRRFFNAPDIVRIRVDGQAVDAVIIGSGDRTNPNATDVDNRVYVIRDLAVIPYSTARPTSTECADPDLNDFRCSLPLSDSDLYDVTDNTINTGTDTEIAAALEALRLANGWRFDLVNAGEKNLAKTLTINGKVFVNTFTPSNLVSDINVCEPQAGTGLMYIIDLYDVSRNTIYLGPIIPDTPSLHFADDGKIRILLPPGSPASSIDEPSEVDCSGGVCDVNENLRPPYGNYWFQESY
jgi:type IV pilus assembly protein PilY1